MKHSIRYIELKTGYDDNGPAWIAKITYSKSRKTIYFNRKKLKKIKRVGSMAIIAILKPVKNIGYRELKKTDKTDIGTTAVK